MLKMNPVKRGSCERMSFGKINEVMDMPNLIEIQKASYKWFIEVGLKEVFRDMADITDYTGNWVLSFVDYRMDDKPKYTVRECKERDATYAAPMRVTVRLQNKETGIIKEAEIIAKAVEGPVTSMVSASAIQFHRDALVIVDEAAAGKLQGKDYYYWNFDNDPVWDKYR